MTTIAAVANDAPPSYNLATDDYENNLLSVIFSSLTAGSNITVTLNSVDDMASDNSFHNNSAGNLLTIANIYTAQLITESQVIINDPAYVTPVFSFSNFTPNNGFGIKTLTTTQTHAFSAGTYYLYTIFGAALSTPIVSAKHVQFTVASGGGGGGGGAFNLTAVITSSTLFPSWTPANTAAVTSAINGIVSQSPYNIPPANVNLLSITSGSTILTYFITGFNSLQDVNNALLLLQNNTWPPNLNIISVTGTESGGNAISNICFPAGTPIQTDQGMVPIERLQPTQHTLAGQAIQHVTQTVTLDPYLICIEPHALGRQYPTAKTVLTKDHLVLYKGQLVPAERLLRVSPQVTKVKYSGEVLYNVLLADHSTMRVNNLVCETLHPDNAIAQLYNSPFSAAYKSNLIAVMNDSLLKKDAAAYKNIVNRLTM